MEIHRVQSAAMIENDAFTGEKIVSGQYHSAVIGRQHFGTDGGAQIRAGVRRSRLSVDDATVAKGRRGFLRHWPDERSFPETFGRRRRECQRKICPFATN